MSGVRRRNPKAVGHVGGIVLHVNPFDYNGIIM